jgi:hypothetical protein
VHGLTSVEASLTFVSVTTSTFTSNRMRGQLDTRRVTTQVTTLACLCLFACSSSKPASGGDAGASPPAAASGGTQSAAASGGHAGNASAGKSAATGGTGANGSAAGKAAAGGGKGGSSASAGKGATAGTDTGTAAVGGSTASAGAGSTAPLDTDSDASVLERNKHASRDGYFLQPTLTKAMAAKLAKDTGFTASFTGVSDTKATNYASPLYLENGPGGKGAFFAVTSSNDVFALDETTGAVLWMKHLGDSPQQSGAGCGSIKPIGILSTPVIDATARTIFVAGAFGTTAIASHQVHALSVEDGTERTGWPVDVTKLKAGSLAFMPQPQNQRSALSLVGGIVYVAYGGHVGDCGNYHGWVVAIDSKDPTKTGAWATVGQGEAIWAAGGMASDGTSVFAVTGNSTVGATMRANSDGEQVVRLHDLAVFDRSDKNLYFPASWASMDSKDAEFGASSPLYLHMPGSTPENYLLAIAKDGHMYLLDSTNLGGMGGHVVDYAVATAGAMTVRTVPAAYTTASGLHVVFSTSDGSKCPGTAPSGGVVMSVLIAQGAPPVPKVVWCASRSGEETAPIATTSDGLNDAIVWFMSNGKLSGVDGEDGKPVFTGSDSCPNVERWTSPIAVKGRIVVGGDKQLCSWSAH